MSNPSMQIRVAANLAELKANLAEGKLTIETTTAAMGKLATSLSGEKLIQQAHNITAAVDSIGGAGALTDAEMKRVNATLDRAIEKYEKLGKDAPPAMLALRDATANAEHPTSALDSVLGLIGPKVIAAFSIGAVTAFVGSLVESAGHINDVAAKLGVSTDAAQRWEYALAQTGGSLDDVARSIVKMQQNLTGDNGGVAQAMDRLGLSLADIRAMSPEKAFEVMAEAVRGIKDPMEQTRIGIALFGKSFAELLPAIREGMVELGHQAPIVSADVISAVDAMGDAWVWLKTSIKTQVTEMIGGPIADWRNVMKVLSSDTETAAREAIAKSIPQTAAFDAVLPKIGATGDALEAMMAAQQKMNAETEKAIAKSDAYTGRIQALADTFTGQDLVGKVHDLSAALALANTQGGIGEKQFEALAKQAKDLRDKGATLTGELGDMAHGLDILKVSQQFAAAGTVPLTKGLKDATKAMIDGKPEAMAFGDALADMARKAELGMGPASLAVIENFGTKVKELPAPPPGPWDEFKAHALGVINDLEYSTAQNVASLIGHWSHWRSVTGQIWEDMKASATNIMGDLLYEFEHRFIKGMLNVITGAQGGFAAAFAGLLNGGPSAAGGAAGTGGAAGGGGGFWGSLGSVAGTTWAAAFGFAALAGVVGWGLWKFFQPHSTGAQTPVIDPGTGDVIYDPNDPNNPSPGFDPGNPWVGGDMGNDGSAGFANGTHGQFLDFGRGTQVTLHGRERVVTEAEGRRESGVSLDAMKALMAEHQRALRQALTENRLQLMAVLR